MQRETAKRVNVISKKAGTPVSSGQAAGDEASGRDWITGDLAWYLKETGLRSMEEIIN